MSKKFPYASDEAMEQSISGRVYGREDPDEPFVKPSQFVCTLDSILIKNPDIPVIPYYRVSTKDQERKGNLQDGIDDLIKKLLARRVNIAPKSFCEVRNGTRLNGGRALREARKYAKKIGGVVVTVHLNRFIRPPNFHPTLNPMPRYPLSTLKELQGFFGRTPFCTLADPDLPENEVRSEQTKRGMKAKGNMGGRKKTKPKCKPGEKKAKRVRLQARAITLREGGYKLDEIAIMIDVAVSTVYDWVKS